MADATNDRLWEETRELEVPWGEIITSEVIFTLPTVDMKRMDVSLIDENFGIIIKELKRYLAVPPGPPYRVVFDAELVPQPARYPFVFHQTSIDEILNSFDEPTAELFNAVMLIAESFINEDSLDLQTAIAVAAVATSVTFQRLFGKFDPIHFNAITKPTLFPELWKIQRSDPKVIPATVAKAQAANRQSADVQDDMWIAFVRDLCATGGKDFTKLLEQAWPIPLNIAQSLHGLPQFVSR
jgi:hypothetical protein